MAKQPDKKTLTSQIITDNFLGSFLRYMPNPDDIARGTLQSYETYRKMRTDPRIKSLLNKLKTTALNFPLHITQSDGCPDALFTLIKGFPLWAKIYQKLKRVYSGLDYGFSVSELVWVFEDGHWIPDNIITRKPERFAFGYDWSLHLNNHGTLAPLNHPYKWLEYHHDTDDENPYGTSVLRCVYWPWMFKQAGYEFWLQATEKFSVKTILALFEESGSEEQLRKRAAAIAEMLTGVSAGSAAAVGNVKSITEIGMDGDISGFNTLVDACDTQISYGLTGQAIATSKTEGGSLALGEVQAEMFYEDAKGIALEGQALMQKIINWAVELNGYENVTPPLAEIDVEHRASFTEVMSALEHGVPVSRSALYERYGLPKPRDEGDTFTSPARAPTAYQLNLADNDAPGKKKARIPARTRSQARII